MALFNLFKKAPQSVDTSKPSILITLPIFHLLTGKEPFADMVEEYDNPKLSVISVYAALYKVYCYNKLLIEKIGKDIYYPMIFEKQRQKLAENDLALSEEYSLLMRMIQELDQVSTSDTDTETGLEDLIAYAMIKKEKEFSDVNGHDVEQIEWMIRISEVLTNYNIEISAFFNDVVWTNSGFTKTEFEEWLTRA